MIIVVSRRGGGRRPPVKRVSSARISSRVARRPKIVLRPEGFRYIRADGTPNWEQLYMPQEGDAKRIASSPAITVSSSSNVLEAVETIAKEKVRGLPVVKAGSGELVAMVTAMDLVNYLGGGVYYNIVINRHKGNIYSALRDESILSIANPTPIHVFVHDKINSILGLMFNTGVGILPVLWPDGTVYGVITEHDIVKLFSDKNTEVPVARYATRELATVEIEATIKRAAEIMISQGFRRLPVVSPEDNSIRGMIHAKDIVRFFGSHEAFKHLTSPNIEEALSTPVYEVMTPGFYTIHEEATISQAAVEMISQKTNALLVVDDNDSVVGILTEHDIVRAILESVLGG